MEKTSVPSQMENTGHSIAPFFYFLNQLLRVGERS